MEAVLQELLKQSITLFIMGFAWFLAEQRARYEREVTRMYMEKMINIFQDAFTEKRIRDAVLESASSVPDEKTTYLHRKAN